MYEREGQGWRIAFDPQRHPFPILIGGEGWASELTAAEAATLHRALALVQRQHGDLVDTLMEEESLCLEFTCSLPGEASAAQPGSLWVALEGDRQAWTLRFVLQPQAGQRGIEGCWARGAAAALAEAYSALDLQPSARSPSPAR